MITDVWNIGPSLCKNIRPIRKYNIYSIKVDDKFVIRVGFVIYRHSKPKPSSESFNILPSLLFLAFQGQVIIFARYFRWSICSN